MNIKIHGKEKDIYKLIVPMDNFHNPIEFDVILDILDKGTRNSGIFYISKKEQERGIFEVTLSYLKDSHTKHIQVHQMIDEEDLFILDIKDLNIPLCTLSFNLSETLYGDDKKVFDIARKLNTYQIVRLEDFFDSRKTIRLKDIFYAFNESLT